ncbi:MAG: hypothetical protein WBP12_05990 [Candidatus Saccharimonas sp.]
MRVLRRLRALVLAVTVAVCSVAPTAYASPFGQGLFGEDVPFGSITSLSINLGGDVSLNLVPDSGNLRGTGSHTITVTSTDVVGYQLFVRSSTSTDLASGSSTIAASANSSPAPLALGSWGFNTDASSDFVGMTTTPYLIKDTTGPSKNGDDTTVTYSAYTTSSQDAGTYTTSVTYTAVAENQ